MSPTDARGRKFQHGRYSPPVKARETLRPLAEKWADLVELLRALSDEETERLVESLDCRDFTTTNCWWAEYQVLHALAGELRDEATARARKRAEALAHRVSDAPTVERDRA